MVFNHQKEVKGKKFGVLLIDDDPAIGSLVKKITNSVNCTEFIGQAHRGMTGVEMIQESLPGLVIIDLHVPGSSGFDLLSWIKDTYPQINVIIISNSLKQEYKMIAESLGADYFLDKQNELNHISEILNKLASKHNCDEDSTTSEIEIKKQVG